MEKKLNRVVLYIKREYQPSLLKEAFKVTVKNGRLVLFITFIMFSYYSLMKFADHLVLEPVLSSFVANSMPLPKNGSFTDSDLALYKPFLKDLRFILAFKFVEWAFLCVVLMFSVAASVHSTYEAHTAKQLGLKDMLCGLRGKIRRPLKTSIWMIIISLASAALLFFTVGVVGVMTEGSVTHYLSLAVLVFAALYYVGVFSLWMLSLVVSVLEENFSGLKAIYQANELMKGKKLKGFGLMVLLILISAAIHKTFACLASLAMAEKVAFVGGAISTLKIWPYCLMKLFVFAVYTLFYHELKQKQQAEENAALYTPISAIAEF
ncbi:uncharacterized protein [Coffea arabica]|uniref:Uncharacterized protein n=1 Tax=Coffea arabica TaxID=13443 RepID=A0A6P6SNA0_COFAR|nr:uncharacterized protein LOC113692945 [Coffea arabica]